MNIVSWFRRSGTQSRAFVVGALVVASLLIIFIARTRSERAPLVAVDKSPNSSKAIPADVGSPATILSDARSTSSPKPPAFGDLDVDYIRRSAELGDADAQNSLCGLYRDGRGVSRDYVQAIHWCREAAEQGNAKAQNNIGFLYENGQGTPRDYVQAAAWYRLGAEQGNANAQCNLAKLYDRGYLGAGPAGIDYEDAVYWYHLAAEQGLDIAQAALGNRYFMSQGVPPEQENYTLAIYWCTRAAAQNNAWAESSLGRFYSAPHSVGYFAEPDYAKSIYWYRRAAEQGDSSAQAALSNMYFHGEGVQQDYAEAYFWWLVEKPGEQKAEQYVREHYPEYKADENAQEFNRERERGLVSHLTSDELSQVQARVQKWSEEHAPKSVTLHP